MGKRLNAIVIRRIEVNPRLIKLRIAPQGWELPDFTPGQFTLLGLPWTSSRCSLADADSMEPRNPEKFILRAYSMASSSVAKEYLEFYINLVCSGLLSPRLFALNENDLIYVSPQFRGMFTLSEVPPEFNVILMATGTGLAPYMSMIRTEVSTGLRRRFAVIHGARHSSDLGYHEELKILDEASSSFSYIPIISHPHEEPVKWGGAVGYVQHLWSDGSIDYVWGFHPSPNDTHVFLSGNPNMIDEASAMLINEGYHEHTQKEPGQFHVERYYED